MLEDLDRLMIDEDIALLIVPMHDARDPSFRWLSRGAKLTHGFVVKRPGDEPQLVHYPMERAEARATGLPTLSALELGWDRIAQQSSGEIELHSRFFRQIAGDSLTGSVAVVGSGPITLYHGVLSDLERAGLRVWNGTEDLIQQARKRKDAREVSIIREVGRRTEQVVEEMAALLRSAEIREGTLAAAGKPITIGDLKDLVSRRVAELGMVEDHDTIIAQGDEAGIPHCRGSRERPLVAGEPLVIDIFPADRDTGYFFDYTRTFVVGEPQGRFTELHAQVLEAFELAVDACEAGMKAGDLQHLVCDYFERQGHATTRRDPSTTAGYVHGLGHGVGLEVHEKPSFSIAASNHDTIERGDILTIEPGLYYPDERIGIRIEETFLVGSDGRLESLCERDRGWRV